MSRNQVLLARRRRLTRRRRLGYPWAYLYTITPDRLSRLVAETILVKFKQELSFGEYLKSGQKLNLSHRVETDRA